MNTEQKWIKTVDRVPRNNGEYLITYVYGDGTVSVGTAEYDGAHWTIHGRDAYDAYIYERYPILVLKNGKTSRGTKISVVAWMPMPEPYKFDVVDLECAHWDDTGSKVRCSRCGASNKAYKSPYCPHCGAKMEGVD